MPALKPKRLLLAPVLCLASCIPLQRNIYRANPIDLPGQLDKGESRVTVGVGGDATLGPPTSVGGLDVRGAYAISDRLTLLGGLSTRSGGDTGRNDYEPTFAGIFRDTNDNASVHCRNNTWELGLAYNFRFNRRVGLSLAAGGGGGALHIDDHGALHDTAYRAYLHVPLMQWFIQPAMYFKARHVVEIAVGLRLSSSSFGHVRTNYTDEQQKAFLVAGLQGNAVFMAQPFWQLTIRPHLSWLQVMMQGSVNVGGPNTSPPTSGNYGYYWLNGSVGIAIDPIRLLKGD